MVLASAALIINPITFHSAPVMKGKEIRSWLGCLGNREIHAALLPEKPAFPDALQHPGPLPYLVSATHRSVHVLSTPALYCISIRHILSTTSERCAHWEPGSRFLSLIACASSGFSRRKYWACQWTFLSLFCYGTKFFLRLCPPISRKFPLDLSPWMLYPCALSVLSLWTVQSTSRRLSIF